MWSDFRAAKALKYRVFRQRLNQKANIFGVLVIWLAFTRIYRLLTKATEKLRHERTADTIRVDVDVENKGVGEMQIPGGVQEMPLQEKDNILVF